MITKYWFDFDGSLRGRAKLTEDSKVRGVQRTLSLLRPYLIESQVAEFDQTLAALSLTSDCMMQNEMSWAILSTPQEKQISAFFCGFFMAVWK